MNRKNLEKHLRSNGCRLHRHGARHDMWINPANGKKAAIPRHNTIPRGTIRSICKQLAVPLPPGF